MLALSPILLMLFMHLYNMKQRYLCYWIYAGSPGHGTGAFAYAGLGTGYASRPAHKIIGAGEGS